MTMTRLLLTIGLMSSLLIVCGCVAVSGGKGKRAPKATQEAGFI